jgi:predicted O-methyltransferase YrrM
LSVARPDDEVERDSTLEQWTAVEHYVTSFVVQPDALLDAAIRAAEVAGLPSISVSPVEGKLLQLLARTCGAKRILEIGTLAGYSTIWLARALGRGGRLVTLESNPAHAAVARENIARAGLSNVVDLRAGLALDILPVIAAENVQFDFTFIDADKRNIPRYFEWALQMSRPGALIVVDNVIRDGRILDDTTDDESVRGVRRLNEMLRQSDRVDATTIQTVGSKGYDGFTLAVVR